MGHPRKSRKNYDTPSHPWNADRIKLENKLIKKYGLKTKKEIWKAETMVKRYRRDARKLLGMTSEQNKTERQQLLSHLINQGFLGKDAKLEELADCFIELLNIAMFSNFSAKELSQAIENKIKIVKGRITKLNKR